MQIEKEITITFFHDKEFREKRTAEVNAQGRVRFLDDTGDGYSVEELVALVKQLEAEAKTVEAA
jgi:hypothetical protein